MCLCVWCLLELIAKAMTPHPSGSGRCMGMNGAVMGTVLSTTGNKHHTPCLIGVAISPLNPNAPHLVMGSSAEENDGVRVSLGGEQCVYSSGAHCICRRMMRMCALEHVCVSARAHARASVCVFVNICEVSWFVGV